MKVGGRYANMYQYNEYSHEKQTPTQVLKEKIWHAEKQRTMNHVLHMDLSKASGKLNDDSSTQNYIVGR